MTGYDVHTDKALKELRARLTEAERERDEARAALVRAQEYAMRGDAKLAEQAARLASEPARVAAAEMARDVAWVRAACSAAPGPRSFLRAGLVTTKTDDIVEAVCSGATYADIAAAIRAARGAP